MKLLYTDLMEYANDAVAQAAYVSSDSGTGFIDTQNTTGSNTHYVYGAAGNLEKLSQSFQVTENCNILKVALKLTKVLSPTDNLVLEVQTDSLGEPSGTKVHANATATIAASGVGSTSWEPFTFTVPFAVNTGTAYWLVLGRSGARDTNNYITWFYDFEGNPYANGHADYVTSGSWVGVIDTSDRVFKVYKEGDNLQSYSEPTIKVQGTYSLKGIALITDSLNDTLTKTLTDYLDYSIQDKIVFQVRSSRTGETLQLQIHDIGGTTSTHNINIAEVDVWQTETWDISGITGTDRDTIDKIIIKVINADATNTFYFDNLFSEVDTECVTTWVGG